MDRGRPPDDETEDVGLGAEDDDTVEVPPTAGAPAPADAVTPGDGSPTHETPVEGGRPAVWLADIRARAPWLLDPDVDPPWYGTDADGPDRIPHGETPAQTWSGSEMMTRSEAAWAPAPARAPGDGTDSRADPAGADETGEGSATVGGRPSSFERESAPAGTSLPSPFSGSPDREADDPAIPARMPWPPADAQAPGPSETAEAWSIPPERPPAAGPDRRPAEAGPAAGSSERPVSPWPDPDPRRPPIRRSSATWSSPTLHPAPTPVWPPRPHPEGSVFPHLPTVGIPDRPTARPATPSITARTDPEQDTSPATRPSWDEDRTGWRSSASSGVPVFDAAAFPTWPSLLEDDDGKDVPDWTPLDRRLERMVRLDSEQRRR